MKQLNQRDAVHYIATRQEFRASALAGSPYRMSEGYLTGKDCEKYYEDQNTMKYIVYSYHTPIAWFTEGNGWYVVEQKFSVTTSKHQNYVRQAIKSTEGILV